MKKILISACLLGENVRYDAKIKSYQSALLMQLKKTYQLIPFCPEVEGGLPIPRPPSEIQEGDGFSIVEGSAKIYNIEKRDVTKNFLLGAKKALAVVQQEDIHVVILKSKSPSCGNDQIYDGTFSGTLKKGKGVTAALFEQEGIVVFNEHELEKALEYLR